MLFILRRHWIEWETFIALRFDFMANGDVENEEKKEIEGSFSFKSRQIDASPKDDVQLHLDQYRNSCIVQYIPESHRRDEEIFHFFDALFPGQVKRAEIILNASKLSELIKERQGFIEKYESVYAKHQHAKQRYHHKREGIISESCGVMYCLKCKCCRGEPKQPQDPTIALSRHFFCCGGKKVKALPYLLSEIKRLNRDFEKEHRAIMQVKNVAEDREEQRDIIASNIAKGKSFFTGTTEELTCDTGFVEFKNLTAKQSALQCNLTGTNGYMGELFQRVQNSLTMKDGNTNSLLRSSAPQSPSQRRTPETCCGRIRQSKESSSGSRNYSATLFYLLGPSFGQGLFQRLQLSLISIKLRAVFHGYPKIIPLFM